MNKKLFFLFLFIVLQTVYSQNWSFRFIQNNAHQSIKSGNDQVNIFIDNQIQSEGQEISIRLLTKEDLVFESFSMDIPEKIPNQVFCNGFQSWSMTEWLNPFEKQAVLNPLVKNFLSSYGDYTFWYKNATDKKHAHSSWFTILPLQNQTYKLFYPLQSSAYFIYEFGFQDFIRLHVELEGKKFTKGEHLICKIGVKKIKQLQEVENYLFAEKKEKKALTGWTSWYYHYTNISDSLIYNRLRSFSKYPSDVIQIDDGWQRMTGDWIANEKFPLMKALVDSIHQHKKKAGLWIAPFIVSEGSEVYKNHPDWLLRNSKGPVLAGINPLWGGWKNRKFYALDIRNAEVQNHLQKTIQMIVQEWGFDLIKADFLYAVGAEPNQGYSRYENMRFALELLKKWMGKAELLGCGVPLEPAVGLVDYCRIGQDMGLSWETNFMKLARNRERISCFLSIRNSLNRWILGTDGLGNDPDVYFLRNQKCKLNEKQKKMIYVVNHLAGKLVFTSDNPDEWTSKQREQYEKIFPQQDSKLINLTYNQDIFDIKFQQGNQIFHVYFNTGKKSQSIILSDTLWDGDSLKIVGKGAKIKLSAYDTRIFRYFPEETDVIWADGKWLGGSDLYKKSIENQNIEFKWKAYYPLNKVWVFDKENNLTHVTGMPIEKIKYGNLTVVFAPFGWKK